MMSFINRSKVYGTFRIYHIFLYLCPENNGFLRIGNVDYDMFPGLSERLESWLGNNHPSKSDLTSLLAEVGGDKAVQLRYYLIGKWIME